MYIVRRMQQFLPYGSLYGPLHRKIISIIKNGFKEEALKSFTIWLCASCYTCQVHCPAKIKKKARYVDVDKCNGSGDCWNNCPMAITPSERIIRKGDMIIKKIEKEH